MVLGTSPSTIQRRRAASQIQAVVRNFLKDRRDTRDYTATPPCGFRHLHVLGIVALGWRTVNPHFACDYAPLGLCRVEGCFGYKSQTLAFLPGGGNRNLSSLPLRLLCHHPPGSGALNVPRM